MTAPHMTVHQKRRFRHAVAALNGLLAELRREHPAASYYLQESTLHVMSGPSHEGHGEKPQPHRSMDSADLHYSGGGAW